MGEFFAFFWPPVLGPGRQFNEPFLAKFFWKLGRNTTSEPLIDFLAYLELELWAKHQNMAKISAPSNPNLCWITPIL